MSARLAVAVLDDYQGVARACAPWDALDADVTFFHDHVEGAGPLGERLAPFDAVVAMRERTPFDVGAAAARGIVVCGTGSLLAALRAGTIAGAGLDVFDTDPLPPDHPLRSAPNTVLTPHLGYVTRATYARFYGDAVEDIAAYLRGTPVRVIGG